MNILCPGAYTWNNKGDAALVLTMLGELRRVFPDAKITILSDTPKLDENKYVANVIAPLFGGTLDHRASGSGTLRKYLDRYLLWRFPAVSRIIESFVKNIVRPFQRLLPQHIQSQLSFYAFLAYLRVATWLLRKHAYKAFPRSKANVVRAFCEADAVVMVPGGYMIAPHARHTHWFRHIAALILARWLRKPTYLYACTLGPFHGKHNLLLARTALSHVELIVLRESSSDRAAAWIVPNVPRALTTDVAFLMPSCPPELTQALHVRFISDARGPIVGISVRDYSFPGHANPEQQRVRYLDAVADAAGHLVRSYGASVFFVPQVIAGNPNDLDIARAIIDRVDRKSSIHLIDADLSPIELRGLYSCFDAFVGVRMHANIFALSELVPTVAIAYEPKTVGIMEVLGLDDCVLDIRTIESKVLIEKVDHLMSTRTTIRRRLPASLQRVRSMASQTADLIAARIEARTVQANTNTTSSGTA